MKNYLSILLFTFSISVANEVLSQQTDFVIQGAEDDSSFYCSAKINTNEFWIGGEYGILKKVDSSGNFTNIKFPNQGADILKIKKFNNSVFITTANAIIYRYDLASKLFTFKKFEDFTNKCFYDIIQLKSGQIIVCGGSSGIAKGNKTIPNGFIAILSENLENIQIVWKKYRKFVWSLYQAENGDLHSFTFNGINTKVIASTDLTTWKVHNRIKGLVHSSSLLKDRLWFNGSGGIRYKKNGIIGTSKKNCQKLNNTGCLWDVIEYNERLLTVSQSGELFEIDKALDQFKKIQTPKMATLYALVQISNSKILLVGHGRTACLVTM